MEAKGYSSPLSNSAPEWVCRPSHVTGTRAFCDWGWGVGGEGRKRGRVSGVESSRLSLARQLCTSFPTRHPPHCSLSVSLAERLYPCCPQLSLQDGFACLSERAVDTQVQLCGKLGKCPQHGKGDGDGERFTTLASYFVTRFFLYFLSRVTLSFTLCSRQLEAVYFVVCFVSVGRGVVLTQAVQVCMRVRSYSWVHPRCSEWVLGFTQGGWIKLVGILIGMLNPYGNKSCAALSYNTFIASLQLLKYDISMPL